MFADILNRGFYHNRISDYLICLAILTGGILAVVVVKNVVIRRLRARAESTHSHYDDFLVERIRKNAIPLAYLGIVEASLRILLSRPRAERILDLSGSS